MFYFSVLILKSVHLNKLFFTTSYARLFKRKHKKNLMNASLYSNEVSK